MQKNDKMPLGKKKLFLVVGRSGSGKTTLVKEVCRRTSIKMVTSYATRPMRADDDPEYPDHIFITDGEADRLLADRDDIIAYTKIGKFRYFTTVKMLEESDIWVIDPDGIRYMLQKYNSRYDLVIIYVCTSWEAGAARAAARGQDEKDYNDRCEAEDGQFSVFEDEMPWKYNILNLGTIEEGADKLEYIIRKECGLREVERIRIKYTNPDLIPLEAIEEDKSDWIDLRAAEDVKMKAGDYRQISLGVCMKLPHGYEAHIVPRSSTFENFGIIQTDGQAVIDNAYSGDSDVWKYAAYALRDTEIHVNDRIAQFRLMKRQPIVRFEAVSHMGKEGCGGFGSTGKA